jgi:hypothetical protein
MTRIAWISADIYLGSLSAVVASGHYPAFVALAYSAVVRLRRPDYGGVGWRSRLAHRAQPQKITICENP